MWSRTCLALKGGGGVELAEEVGRVVVEVVVEEKGETRKREAGTETETERMAMPEKEFGRRKGWRTRASYGPTQKLPRRWCLFGRSLAIAWTGLDGWMNSVLTGTVTARQKKNVICWGRHTPTYRGTPVGSRRRGSGRRASDFGTSGTPVSQWPMQGVAQRTKGSSSTKDPPPTPWSAKYRYFAGQWRSRAAIRGLHIFGGMGLEKSGHLSTGALGGPLCPDEAQRDHSSPPSPRPSPTLVGQVYPSPTDLVETASEFLPLVARVGVPDASVGLSGPSPSPPLPMPASQRHPTSIPGPLTASTEGNSRGEEGS